MGKSLQLFLGACLVVGLSGCGGSSAPAKTDTQVANDFFKSLRTQVSSIVKIDENGTNGFLNTEAENMAKELKNVTLNAALVKKYLDVIGQLISDSMDAGTSGGTKENVEEGRNVTVTKQLNFNWSYTITQNSKEIGKGNVKMPGDSMDLQLDADDSLSLILDGTFPLYTVDENPNSDKQQKAKANIVVSKQNYGALLDINELILQGDDNVTVKLSDIKSKVYYVENIKDINYTAFEGVKVDMSAGSYVYNGILTAASYVNNDTFNRNNGYLPEKIVYNGVIQNSATGAKLDGSLSMALLDVASMDLNMQKDSLQDLFAKITLTGDLERPSMPKTKVSLGYEYPKNAENKTVTFSYAYDKTSVKGKAVVNDKGNGVVTIDGSDGISAVIKLQDGDVVYGEVNSFVSRNGKKIGYFTERNGVPVILYNDGTFESLQ